MKKQFGFALAAVGVMFAGAVAAAPAALPANGRVDVISCPLLADDVVISASNNVIMGFNCEGTAQTIQVASCHTSGRTGERTVPTPCDADPLTATVDCAVPPAPALTQVTSSANIYVGRSNGGKLQPAPFNNADRCVIGTVNGKIPNLNAAP